MEVVVKECVGHDVDMRTVAAFIRSRGGAEARHQDTPEEKHGLLQ